MQSIPQKNTKPEVAIRSLLHRLGYRFRLHKRDLPGTPDIVFPIRKKVIFVHGCYWHGHECSKGQLPKSRLDYWQAKIARNKERDIKTVALLVSLGWNVMTAWQCELRDEELLKKKLIEFLEK